MLCIGLFWALAACSAVLYALALIKSASYRKMVSRRQLAVPLLAIGSYVWLLLGCWQPTIWGGYYTNLRFFIIGTNWVGMLVLIVAASRAKPSPNKFLLIACIFTFLMWWCAAVVNVVV